MLPLLLVLLAAPALAPVAPRPQERRPSELLHEIERLGNDTPEAVFEELGRQRSPAALRALLEGIEHLSSGPALTRGYTALRHFVGEGALEKKARGFLAERLEHPDHFTRWYAVEPLVAFGPAGCEVLWEAGLETTDPYLRQRVGKALLPTARARGDGEALAFLLRVYDVTAAGARASLVEALGDFRGSGLGRTLGGALEDEHLDPELATAVLEGLATVPGDDVTKAMVAALRSESSVLASAAIAALRRRGDPSAARGLERVARGRDPELRAEARAALVDLLDAPERDEWIRHLSDGLADDDEGERLLAVDALATLREPATIALLVAGLEHQEERAVRQQIASALRDLTGLDLGDQHGAWARWWADAGATFVLPTRDAAVEAEHARLREAWLRDERYDFYGLKVESRRVCFVLDASGSMHAKNEIGLTRLDVARRQLSGALERLPDGALFDVIFFGSRLEILSETPLVMDAEQRAAALARVRTQGTLGLTAVYDALERAFALEDIDTIYLLTDGSPSGGKVNDRDEIRAAVAGWNEARKPRVTVHCVSVGGTQRLLADLASDSGGQYVEVDVEEAGKRR